MNPNETFFHEEAFDTKISFISDYQLRIFNEDHTLMAPLQYILSNTEKNIEMASYTKDHPSKNYVNFRVQYKEDEEQTQENITKSMIAALEKMEVMCDEFLEEVEEKL